MFLERQKFERENLKRTKGIMFNTCKNIYHGSDNSDKGEYIYISIYL